MPLVPPKLFIAFFISMLPAVCVSQNTSPVIDSLNRELNRHTTEDTVRVDIYLELVYALYVVNPQKGLEIADKAIALSKKVNNPKRVAASFAHKGLSYMALGEDSLALICYRQALALHKKLNNQAAIATTLHNIGRLYNGQSEYRKAIEHHRQSYNMLKELNDTTRMMFALNSIGVNYMSLADYNKALQTFFNVLLLAERINHTHLMASSNTNIGIIYKNMGDYKRAILYHNKAYELSKQINNIESMANCLGNLGVVYDLQEKYTDALALYFRALKMGSEMGNKRIMASNHTNIGASYRNLNKRDSALVHFQKAKLLYEYLKDNNNLASVLSQTGEIYAHQKKFTQAIELQKKALQYATSAEAPDSQNEIWRNLFETYKKQGDYKNALTALEKHIALNDSILDKEEIQQLSRKEAEFENEKKTAILQATHTAELKRQKTVRNFLIGGAGLLLAAGAVLFWSYKRRRDAEELAQITDTQMKVLRLQMNPHFIFNSLSSISDYISRNNVDEAGEYLASFAKVMRLTLENSEQKEVSLADDLEALHLYMQLEAKRLNNKFTYSIDVADDIDQENTLVPPMLLQPFAENSIWHGIGKKQGNGHITISIHKQNNMLHCSVEDDGIGRTGAAQQTAPGEKKSLGMKITQSRIDMLNKLKNTKATVQLTDKENGLKAEVILPLETAF